MVGPSLAEIELNQRGLAAFGSRLVGEVTILKGDVSKDIVHDKC